MANATISITRRAADRLRDGHLWVYRSEIEVGRGGATPVGGSLVTVAVGGAALGAVLGTALYSSASQIAARMVSGRAELSRAEYLGEVHDRVLAALALRRALSPLSAAASSESLSGASIASTAQRLVFAEADGLPGILADRYNDLVLVQLLTQGTAQDDVRAAVVAALRAGLGDDGALTIWERPDPRIRELEQLQPPPAGPLFSSEPEAPATTVFTLNGVRFHYDAAAGQKTGAFLDQRMNYVAAARVVAASGRRQRGLDVCTYQGGFALHLAGVCAEVTGVDASRAALEAADRNLLLNPQLTAAVDWVEADAFDYLRHLDETQGATAAAADGWDAMVLDPPAFAKSKRAAEGAARGYKELNRRAMRLLRPGGTLVTHSCSHHVSLEEFTGIVTAAAAASGRRVQLLETHAAAPDHPEILTLPETRYLKCLICRVD